MNVYAIPGLQISTDTIRQMTEQVCGLLPGTTFHKTRKAHVVIPRAIVVYLTLKHLGATHQQVTDYYGYKNHSSSVHAQSVVEDILATDSDYTKAVRYIEQKIESYVL